jgi:hypothetical protein
MKKFFVWSFLLVIPFGFVMMTSCNDSLESPNKISDSSSFNLKSTSIERISVSDGNFIRNNSVWHPAGMNYTKTIDIDWKQYNSEGEYVHSINQESHKTLLVISFDINAINNAFSSMAHDGYNFVRVMINNEGEGTASGSTYYGVAGPYQVGANHKYGLYIPYMDNFVDLLTKANEKGLYVIPCLNYLPYNSYYQSNLTKPVDDDGNFYINDVNLLYMNHAHIDAKVDYIKNFIQYIKDEDSNLLSTILGYDFHNELNVVTTAAPFSRDDLVSTADGNSYDMSIDADRQQCVDANFVNWANQCMSAMLNKDPSGMGCGSVFTFHAVGKTGPNGVHSADGSDPRYPARPASLSLYSDYNFLDMHLYPDGGSYTVDDDLNSSEFSSIDKVRTPLILGEFGAIKDVYSTITDAAYGMKNLKDYCKDNKDFKGWAFWTWDSNQEAFYNATESNGAINGQLAPSVWGW